MKFFKKILIATLMLSFVFVRTAEALSILRDEEIERMLREISTPIFEQANIPPNAVKFILVNDASLNAFVAAGQNIFVNSGLILATDNVEELLGVIAHETGHIASGHLVRLSSAAENLSFQAILSSLLGIVVAVGTGSPEAGAAVSRLGTDSAYKTMLKYTRTHEGSADQAAIRFLQGADLPVSGLFTFLQKLEDQELLPSSQQSEYLRTHPLTQDRVRSIEHVVNSGDAGKVKPKWQENHKIMQAKTLGYLSPDEQLIIRGSDFANRYGHAFAYYRKGNFDKSLPLINSLLEERPNNPYLYELKGQIYYNKGDLETSIKAYQKSIELLPDSGLLQIGYAYSLLAAQENKDAREKEAIRILHRALLIERNSSEPHHLLGIAYGRQGNEGMSALHLAEEAFMNNKTELAKINIRRALARLEKGSPSYLRAESLLEKVENTDK